MASERQKKHVTKLCATVEKLTAPIIVRLGDVAIIYNTAGHRRDAEALLALKKAIEVAVDDFKHEMQQRYL